MSTTGTAELLGLTAEIVSAHLSNNSVALGDVPTLIRDVHRTLSSVGEAASAPAPAEVKQPAVPVRKSITLDYIVCLEDGKRLKMMKRHLMTSYGMTPDQYRQKWGLPRDYPMVAPNYAAKRSELAKSIGLGSASKGRAKATAPVEPFKRGAKAATKPAPART